MLHITIIDTETKEVIYDEEVSTVIMQAAEGGAIRALRRATESTSAKDILGCIAALRKEWLGLDLTSAIANAIDKIINVVCSDESED